MPEPHRLVSDLIKRTISILLAEHFDRSAAEAAGASLARLSSARSDVPGQLEAALVSELIEVLPPEQISALQPRVAVLAAAYLKQLQSTILDEHYHNVERLAALREIDGGILAAQSTEEIACAALSHIKRLIPCDLGSVALFDLEADEAQMISIQRRAGVGLGTGDRLPLEGAEEALEALRQGRALTTEDIRSLLSGTSPLQALEQLGFGSWMVVPLSSADGLVGSLNLAARDENAFRAEDVEVAQEVADSLAVAIERANLLESVRREAKELRGLTRKLTEIQEAERHRLMLTLHDEFAQNLIGLTIKLGILEAKLPEEASQATHSHVQTMSMLTEELTERLRCLMAELWLPMLDDYGLVPTLEWYGEESASRSDIPVTVQAEELTPRLPAHVENALFRIVQERLSYVTGRTGASRVTISVSADEEVARVVVVDDGSQDEAEQSAERVDSARFGLLTMRERAQAVGASLRVESYPQQSTRLVVEVPR